MSSQRYHAQDHRYPPTDDRRAPERTRSPPRSVTDRYTGDSYPRGLSNRIEDYPPHFDSSWDRNSSHGPRGVPRGPRANFDESRTRASYSAQPLGRGRGAAPRGNVRSDYPNSHRDVYRENPPPRDARDSDPWDRERQRRDDELLNWRSGERSPLGYATRAPIGEGDHREAAPPEREFGRGRGINRDAHDHPYDDASSRWRGPGRFRGRGDWPPARGQSALRDERRPHLNDWNRSPGSDPRADRNLPRSRSPFGAQDDRYHEQRRGPDHATDRRAQSQVFDPFTQDRAVARELVHESRPQSPTHPPSRTRDNPYEKRPALLHDSEDSGLARVQSQQNRGDRRAPDVRRNSSHFVNAHSRQTAQRLQSIPGTSSPPQAPQVPAFGSVPDVHPPTAPKGAPVEPRSVRPPSAAPTAPKGPRLTNAPPTAPKAEVDRLPPTAPKAARGRETSLTSDVKVSESRNVRDGQNAHAHYSPHQPFVSGSKISPSTAYARGAGPTMAHKSTTTQQASSLASGPRAGINLSASPKTGVPIPTGPKASRAPQAVLLPPPPPPPLPPPRPNATSTPSRAPNVSAPTGPSVAPTWQRSWPGTSQFVNLGNNNHLPIKRNIQGFEKSYESEVAQASSQTKSAHDRYTQSKNGPNTAAAGIARSQSPPKSPAWGEEPPDFGLESPQPPFADEVRFDVKHEASKNGYDHEGNHEDFVDLDEADFQDKEEQFFRDRAKLEDETADLGSRYLRGVTPLDHLNLLSELAIIDLPQPDEAPFLSQGDDDSEDKIQPSTPEAPEQEELDISEKYKSEALPDPITDQEIDLLPFLCRESRIQLEDLPTFHSNVDRHERDKSFVVDWFDKARLQQEKKEQAIRLQYRELYHSWIDRVEDLDNEPREESPEAEESLQPLPLLDAPPLQLSTGGRRGAGAGMGSDFDLERVLQESRETASREERKRKNKESSAKFHPDKEVFVPPMLDDADRTRPPLFDTRHLCLEEDLRIAYRLEPEPDNFTQDEHQALVHQFFNGHAKKWGTLAQEVGNDRSYKDVIRHYYSSKWHGDFKDRRDSRRQRTRGGRARAGAKPKSNALISNLGDGGADYYDADEYTNAIMTDSGRPRRAAAPNFGSKEFEESSQATPAPPRRAPKTMMPQDLLHERPPRRSRGGGRERGGQRRQRHPSNMRGGSPSPEAMDEVPTEAADEASAMPQPSLGEFYHAHPYGESAMIHPIWPVESAFDQDATRDSQSMASEFMMSEASRGLNPSRKPNMSSYWSVNEINLFHELVHELGSDWQSISQRLGTKTAVMVKNFHKRALDKGLKPGLEEVTKRADERRRGTQPQSLAPSLVSPSMREPPTSMMNAQQAMMRADEPPSMYSHLIDMPGRGSNTDILRRERMPAYGSPPLMRQGLSNQARGSVPSVQDSTELHLSQQRSSILSPRADASLSAPRLSHDQSSRETVTYSSGSVGTLNDRAAEGLSKRHEHSEYDRRDPPRPASFPTALAEQPSSEYLDRRYLSNERNSEQTHQMMASDARENKGDPNHQDLNWYPSAPTSRSRDTFRVPSPHARPTSPRQERHSLAPLQGSSAIPREPRKQPGLAALLNPEPDSPAPKKNLPPTQVSSFPDFPAQRTSQQHLPDAERQDIAAAVTQYSSQTSDAFPLRRSADGMNGRHATQSRFTLDWTSRVIPHSAASGHGRAIERPASYDYSQADLEAHRDRRVPSPPSRVPSIEHGASPGLPSWTHETSGARRTAPIVGSRADAHRISQPGTSYGELMEIHHARAQELQRQQEQEQEQRSFQTPSRPSSRFSSNNQRGDDFLMHGSGSYRSLSAQRHYQHHQNYAHQQLGHHAQHDVEQLQQPQRPHKESGRREQNPFHHAETQSQQQQTQQRNLAETYQRPSTTTTRRPEGGFNGPQYGRLGAFQGSEYGRSDQ